MKKTLMLAALASQVFAGASFAKSKHQKPAYVEGEVIVKLKQGSIDSFMHSKLNHLMEANHRINVDYGDYLIIKLDQKMTLEQAIKELKKNPDVELEAKLDEGNMGTSVDESRSMEEVSLVFGSDSESESVSVLAFVSESISPITTDVVPVSLSISLSSSTELIFEHPTQIRHKDNSNNKR